MKKRAHSQEAVKRKVIIIGATSGIGRELVKCFVSNGFNVGISGRRNDLLISLQKKFPKNIVTECFDVTSTQNILHVRSLVEKLNGVDIMVYCSGYGEVSKTLDWDIEKQTTDVNVNGFTEIIAYAFNYFLNQGSGQLAAISSIASLRGSSLAPAYNASKAWQSVYMEGLYFKAKKLKVNIAVTDIQPGFVDTAMAKGNNKFWVATPKKAARQIFNAILKKRKRVYVTRRWWLIAMFFKYAPDFIFKKFD